MGQSQSGVLEIEDNDMHLLFMPEDHTKVLAAFHEKGNGCDQLPTLRANSPQQDTTHGTARHRPQGQGGCFLEG